MAPATLTIIRHGEKPEESGHRAPYGVDADGSPCSSSLTTQGWERAGALGLLLGEPAVPRPFVRPTAIVTPSYGAQTPRHRTTQTVSALARRLGLTPLTPYPKGSEGSVAAMLLDLDGDVLICWEHHHIPALVAALAATLQLSTLPSLATQWPDDDFSSALVITLAPTAMIEATRQP